MHQGATIDEFGSNVATTTGGVRIKRHDFQNLAPKDKRFGAKIQIICAKSQNMALNSNITEQNSN